MRLSINRYLKGQNPYLLETLSPLSPSPWKLVKGNFLERGALPLFNSPEIDKRRLSGELRGI